VKFFPRKPASGSPAEAGNASPPILRPVTPCVPAEAHPYRLYDFFMFRGVFFGRGLVEHAPGDRPRLSLRLPDDSWLAAPYGPDPVFPDVETQTGFNFSVPLPGPTTGEAAAAIALFVHFKDDHLNIANPAAARLQSDRFVASEQPFSEAIRAAPHGRVLEIGSRARSGITRRELFPATMEYVGFDIAPGPNVDVLGDAHALSAYFPPGYFDAALSISVWEHLAMPWKVSIELNRVLKTGAVAMINTHQSWPSHEEPWDYFRFSEYSWAALFNAATGFEILSAGMGYPAVMASAFTIPHLQKDHLEWHYGFLASRCVIRKIGPTTLEWPVATEVVSPGRYSH
jgi:hypothetical protein